MTRPAYNATPKIETVNHLEAGRLHLGDGRCVYRRITATVDNHEPTGLRVELEIEVDKAGAPHCRSVKLAADPESRAFDDSITTDAFRKIPLATLVHQCFLEAQFELVETDSADDVLEVRGLDRRELYAMYPKGARRSKQRKPMSDDELQAVAKLYRLAAENNYSPTKLIAERHHVNRSTARRWVKRAVDRGFLSAGERLDPAEGAKRRRSGD